MAKAMGSFQDSQAPSWLSDVPADPGPPLIDPGDMGWDNNSSEF